MTDEQILAFRVARSGLAARSADGLAKAAACPASDFVRGEPLETLPRAALDDEAQRMAALRGAAEAKLVVA